MHFEVKEALPGMGDECQAVLRRLPEWFGIESDILAYAERINVLPTYTAISPGTVVGFLSLERHFPESAEIHVMGVVPEFHYRSVGRALMEKAEHDLRHDGVKFLQVKRLGV